MAALTGLLMQYGFAEELSSGKDTPSGHWEIAGVPVLFDWGYFTNRTDTFPQELLDKYADRTGRGFALAESMRHKVYEAMEAYHKALYGEQLLDWGDVPRQMWRLIQSGQAKPPTYDVILVDEAQFFAPIWFEIIKMILKPATSHLFLVADPSQGFPFVQ